MNARLIWLMCLLCGLMAFDAAAQSSATDADSALAWSRLSGAQRQTLAPLARDWQSLDDDRKRKWLELANRYPSLPAPQQQRIQQRMADWARLTPQQRGQARANFQQAQQIPAPNRQAQWEAYKALPQEEKDALARKAAAAASTPSPVRPLRTAPLDAQAPKSNTVSPVPAAPARVVAPTVVQTGPGASTRLVTSATPKPPQHQPAGGPKIDVRERAIDRATLLPRRSLAEAAPASQPGRQP